MLKMLKEGFYDSSIRKLHGFSANFSIVGNEVILRKAKNIGKTFHLISKWNQAIEEFSSEQSKRWLFWLEETEKELNEAFENFAAVVSGKIQFSRSENSLIHKD